MTEKTVNKKYKDRLFRKLFGDPENKGNLLALFNALHGTDYTDENDLEITTIEDVIYMSMKNDCSCIIEECMDLYEQQSTFNPNMPLRGFMYFGKLYSQFVETNKLNVFSAKLHKIPTPGYYVLYNGNENMPDRMVLKLSDAFARKVNNGLAFEWTALMININEGHNTELLEACKILKDYSTFIGKIKRYSMAESIASAVRRAIEESIEEGVLADFLIKHRAEVIEMCLTEYDEAATMADFKKTAYEDGLEEGRAEGMAEGRTEGIAEGIAEGRTSTLIMLVKAGKLNITEASSFAQMNEDEFSALLNASKLNILKGEEL